MLDLHFLAQTIRPIAIYSYIDIIRVWIATPLTKTEKKYLREQCRNRRLKILNERARFDPIFVQRLRLHQPNRAALEFLSARRDTHISYVEVSLDWTFESEIEKDEAWEFACKYLIKRNHGKQGIRFIKGITRYSGPRKAPNVIAIYADRPSKVRGEKSCVHFDWRIKGAQALKRAGITAVSDLLSLNPRQFWLDRLIFRGVSSSDIGSLGRIYNNWARGSRRRGRWVLTGPGKFEYDADRRVGSAIIRALQSTQALIDTYGRELNLSRVLSTINENHLLPRSALDFP